MSKLDDLLARIKADVVIRRTKSGNATVEGPKQREAREKRERGGTSSDPALRAMIAASNATSKHFGLRRDPYENFHPVAHTPLLQRQVCRCCSAVQINVAAELLHLRGRVAPDTPIADVWVRRSTVITLPIEEPLWATTQSVAHCAKCVEEIRGEHPETFGPTLPPVEADGQIPLIH